MCFENRIALCRERIHLSIRLDRAAVVLQIVLGILPGCASEIGVAGERWPRWLGYLGNCSKREYSWPHNLFPARHSLEFEKFRCLMAVKYIGKITVLPLGVRNIDVGASIGRHESNEEEVKIDVERAGSCKDLRVLWSVFLNTRIEIAI